MIFIKENYRKNKLTSQPHLHTDTKTSPEILKDRFYFFSPSLAEEAASALLLDGVLLLLEEEETWVAAICQAGIPTREPPAFNVAERREDSPSVAGEVGALDAGSSELGVVRRLSKSDFNDFISL